MIRAVLAFALLWFQAPSGVASEAASDWQDVDGELPPAALLAIGLVPLQFTLDDEDEQALRQAEARYIPYLLRVELESSRRWGPVRVVTEEDPSVAELWISGRVLESDGDHLAVQLRVRDATGRIWIDQAYRATVALEDYGELAGSDPFAGLYDSVIQDLEQFRASLSLQQLQRIVEVSRLRYAEELAPEAYGGYLDHDADSTVTVRRLPAENDPMLVRVERTREAEYLFIDTVDQNFRSFYLDMRDTYTDWRRSTLEAGELLESYRRSSSGRGRKSMKKRYSEFREVKLYEQTLREAMEGFEFEVGPTALDLNGELVELTGTLEEQQARWKSLLRQIHAAETGLPATPAGSD